MKHIQYITYILFAFLALSCITTQSTTIANNVNLSKYKYVVFGHESEGDAELDDMILKVENHISEVLEVVNPARAKLLLSRGEYVLSPRINIKTEKWDGGQTYLTINFHDFDTGQSVAVIKSSGLGLTVAHDQSIAYNALVNELYKAFNLPAPMPERKTWDLQRKK